VYVWWDALTNYVTALGYGGDDAAYREWWLGAAERVHVIGKGIVRFHAVYWLALLLSAGQPLPTAIFVHEYLTVDGAKLSKSAGNAVSPYDLAGRYGSDAVRWWLLREVAGAGDTDFTERRLLARYHQDLANGLGNLVNRTVSLVHKHRGGVVGEPAPAVLPDLPAAVDRALAVFDFRAATGAIAAAVTDANRFVEAERPWEGGTRLDTVLGTLVATGRVLARELSPFLPAGAARLTAQLGAGSRVAAGLPPARRATTQPLLSLRSTARPATRSQGAQPVRQLGGVTDAEAQHDRRLPARTPQRRRRGRHRGRVRAAGLADRGRDHRRGDRVRQPPQRRLRLLQDEVLTGAAASRTASAASATKQGTRMYGTRCPANPGARKVAKLFTR
jgi:methionyl-tRNA synthetase